MPTDFEQALSGLLHDVTPEPPAGLGPPTIVTLVATEPRSGTEGPASVIELAPDRIVAPRRRRRWAQALAAAAVAALIAGIVVAVQSNDPGRTPAAIAPVRVATGSGGPVGLPPTQTTVPAAPGCSKNQLVLSDGKLSRRGHLAIDRLHYGNMGAQRCSLELPSVAISDTATGGTSFPTPAHASRPAEIPGHGRLAIIARMRISGQCHAAKDGLHINLLRDGWTYSFSLHIAGCTLTPLRWTPRVVS